MTWKLFIDDERDPSIYPEPLASEMVVVRTYAMAINLIDFHGIPEFIAFDHDLADPFDRTGYDLAKYIVELDINNTHKIPDNFTYNVHSANPMGAANIRGYLDGYLKHR